MSEKECTVVIIQDQMRRAQIELIHLYLLFDQDYPDKAREALGAANMREGMGQ